MKLTNIVALIIFWSMEFYATHDNKPLSEDVVKTDYGIITGLGWSY